MARYLLSREVLIALGHRMAQYYDLTRVLPKRLLILLARVSRGERDLHDPKKTGVNIPDNKAKR